MAVRVITPATQLLVSRDDLKAQLRLEQTDTDSDTQIDALNAAAQALVEMMTQRRYGAQVLEWVRDSWCDTMVLPLAPGGDSSKVTINSVKYADLEGVQQTLDPATMYWVRPAGPTQSVVRQWFAVWPWLGDAAERVVIRFTIASEPTDAPANIIHAIKLLVGHWYANREAVVGVNNRDSSGPLPLGVEELVDAERWS